MTDPQHEETFADTERKLREIITTLRAQLAEARVKERQWIEKMVDAEARADRAEAALAAQIEVDAGICEGIDNQCGMEMGLASSCADTIRSQPHDRTALDRHDAKTREKALREAAAACIAVSVDPLTKAGREHASWMKATAEDCSRAILAMIDKEKTK